MAPPKKANISRKKNLQRYIERMKNKKDAPETVEMPSTNDEYPSNELPSKRKRKTLVPNEVLFPPTRSYKYVRKSKEALQKGTVAKKEKKERKRKSLTEYNKRKKEAASAGNEPKKE
uniref:Uncharacterized protein n=1 Tax=Panagrolaimus davidi TaxID=227884 RepID=A0A914QXM0_9BILA